MSEDTKTTTYITKTWTGCLNSMYLWTKGLKSTWWNATYDNKINNNTNRGSQENHMVVTLDFRKEDRERLEINHITTNIYTEHRRRSGGYGKNGSKRIQLTSCMESLVCCTIWSSASSSPLCPYFVPRIH